MLKILSNLKKTSISVIIIILLLCLQAWADLTLPDYTSKIVNIGIQQGGIEYAVPKVLSKEQMDTILLFTNEDESILSYYTYAQNSTLTDEENKILEDFDIKNNGNLYIIKNEEDLKKGELTNKIAKPLMLSSYMQNEEMAVKIEQMPKEQVEAMFSTYKAQIDQMQESIIEQSAIATIKQNYKNIGIDTDKIQNNYIFMAGLQMLGIAFISMGAAITIMLLSARVAATLGRTLRDKVFKKVMSFSTKEFREFSTASLITRSTNDIQQIQGLIGMLFRVVVYAPIIGIGGFIRVLNNSDTSMAWIIGLAIACIIGIVLILFIVAMPKFRKLQDLVDKLNLVSREILTGLPVIRAFNTQKREEKRFDIANTDLMKTNMFVNRAMSIMMPALMLVMNSITLLIIWIGGNNVDKGIMQVGDIMAFIQYTMQIVMSFLMISMISIMLPRASVSARRINEVLETKPSIQDNGNKEFKEDKKGLVEFKNVSFRYPDADTEILTDIDFTAKPGETTAIIGTTGSGKSTVVNLIPRFYDVTGGELLINGVNIKEVPQKELRKIVGFVPQKGVLFSGTIESNIKYGNPEMSDEQMIKAARIAQAEEFIQVKEEKYKAPIAQGGNNVSGGQKQRLSIARALAIEPQILVFDDSFSALDLKTDSKLRETLAKETVGKTIIIVAQRISTIMNAEQIIVLDEGKILGKGTHEELMKTCETYRQIALSQLSEKELSLGTEQKDSYETTEGKEE